MASLVPPGGSLGFFVLLPAFAWRCWPRLVRSLLDLHGLGLITSRIIGKKRKGKLPVLLLNGRERDRRWWWRKGVGNRWWRKRVKKSTGGEEDWKISDGEGNREGEMLESA
ncbi:hypothetical protein BJ684DRAFT_17207 [Piptocephalis cylindrospora]|uniref:Uncharacterized protein n=1 Tax=Piptocephalis cylindrospora TaxID=1907219 RepID=A0A4P9Y388_9FUNG|nr:hypothetical protein BJ684DRAFT_17207 [Piptocephalis cylindrospora]|eukprot:RKP12290.1 hypothetical protein BJ684DRAFT_17207 [Piptocephalis cylindrospora]